MVNSLEETKNLLLETASIEGEYDLNQAEFNVQIIKNKEAIVSYRAWIKSNFPMYVTDIDQKLNTSDSKLGGKFVPWEEKYFHHAPLAAVFTFLTKYQADIRAVESHILDSLKVSMDNEILKTQKP